MTHNRLSALCVKPALRPLNRPTVLDYSLDSPIFGALLLAALLFGVMLFSSLDVSAQTHAKQINNVRLWHSPDKTRVVFDVSEHIKHSIFILKNPERLVVDIENAGLQATLPSMQTDNLHLKGVRSGSPRDGVLRFVFELKKPLQAHSFVLTPNELYGYRLVLDLIDTQVDAVSSSSNVDRAATEALPAVALDNSQVGAFEKDINVPQAGAVDKEPIIATPVNRENQKITIAIDAGHGGEDPGATGHKGSREKKITLSIAKHLQKVINTDSRMQAFLIREGDYYIDLARRRALAEEKNADIFVSIHADAFTKKSANGLSVFALSQRGATSAMARALAKKENAADLIGGVSLTNRDAVLDKVLVDLSMTHTISESVNLGGRVLKELSSVGRLHSKRVEQASFVVLKSTKIPSILVETGFITNLSEEKRLRSSKYQKKIANAIHRALGEYYEQTPYYNQANYLSPDVTTSNSGVVDRPTGTKQHKVRRGDSLSTIALKYGTTVAELKRVNKLRSNVVVLGQRLKLSAVKKTSQSNNSVSAKPDTYIIKRGDSLSKISARYNVTINALKRVNGLTRNAVYKGQEIKIPRGAATPAAKATKHKVTRGDTLSEIAEKYGVTIKAIMRANALRSRTVQLGQTLKIP